jgi:hypothetical protein
MVLLNLGLLMLALWIAYYLVRCISAFAHLQEGRGLADKRGAEVLRNETMRHGRAIAAANDWRNAISQEREDEARQAVERG